LIIYYIAMKFSKNNNYTIYLYSLRTK
jgi:hypothetical protein